jgi:hypothetical protein
MVLLEVVSAHSPLAFLTEGPALCFATFREPLGLLTISLKYILEQ